ncbi:hypothetical protein J6590_030561 [Homalodisca vitripennis]|nr:hypothetical protein J6590_030561 [Homalodisca vitripennis]
MSPGNTYWSVHRLKTISHDSKNHSLGEYNLRKQASAAIPLYYSKWNQEANIIDANLIFMKIVEGTSHLFLTDETRFYPKTNGANDAELTEGTAVNELYKWEQTTFMLEADYVSPQLA